MDKLAVLGFFFVLVLVLLYYEERKEITLPYYSYEIFRDDLEILLVNMLNCNKKIKDIRSKTIDSKINEYMEILEEKYNVFLDYGDIIQDLITEENYAFAESFYEEGVILSKFCDELKRANKEEFGEIFSKVIDKFEICYLLAEQLISKLKLN